MRENMDKVAFFGIAAMLVVLLSFAAGLYSGVTRNIAYKGLKKVRESFQLVLGERENLLPGGTPVHFLQPARTEGSGVTVNKRPDDGALIMISGFFEGANEIRLMQRDGTPVVRWRLSHSEHFPDTSFLQSPPATDRNIDTHGALVHPDGSVVFNYDYGGTVKLSRCGEIVWALSHPTHHSIEIAEVGGYWIPGRHYIRKDEFDKYPPLTRQGKIGYYLEDLLLLVSGDGEILRQKAVPEMFFENDLGALLTATGYVFAHGGFVDTELTHVNKIEELPEAYASSFSGFDSGDLLVSMRTFNLLFVVDPDDWTIKWYQVGPWLRQHDPEFHRDGTFTVFNNNTYETDHGEDQAVSLDSPRVSNIIRMDPETREYEVVYGQREGEEFNTVVRGKHEVLESGGYLLTEFEAGRVFEIDTDRNLVWEYINRYDESRVLEVTEARLYPASYFEVSDWSCN